MNRKILLNFAVIASVMSWQNADAVSTIGANQELISGEFIIDKNTQLLKGYYIKNFLNALKIKPGTTFTVYGTVHNYNTIAKEGDGADSTIKLQDEGRLINYESYIPALTVDETGTFNKASGVSESGTGWDAPSPIPSDYDPDDASKYLDGTNLKEEYKKSAYYDLYQDQFYPIEDSIYHDGKKWPPLDFNKDEDKAKAATLREYQNIREAKIEGVTVSGTIETQQEGFDRFLYTRDQIEEGAAATNDVKHRAYYVPAETKLDIDTGDIGWDSSYQNEQTSKHSYASFYSIEGYNGIAEVDAGVGTKYYAKTVAEVDKDTVITKKGAEDWVIHGDQSWYNGVVNITAGKLDVYAEGAMFGGDINLSRDSAVSDWVTSVETGDTGVTPEPSITWRGGSKDPDNKPTITLGHGTHMNFNLDEGTASGEGEYADMPVFSFYGKIQNGPSTDPEENFSDTYISFKKGIIFIKGDCSGFKGKLRVAAGSKFVIRDDIGSHGKHEGKMFQGTIEVTENANAENVTLDLTESLHPITQENGTILITNTDGNVSEVHDLTTGQNATTQIDVPNATMHGTTIHGTVDIVSGDQVTFNNLDIDGGMLMISGASLGAVNIQNSFSVGSGINMMGNDIIDTVTIEEANIKVYEGRNFDLYVDLDPASGTADNITAPNCEFTGGSSLNIADYKLLSTPVEESYAFRILTLTDANAKYLPITIGTDKTVEGNAGIYRLYAEGGDGFITLRTEKATVSTGDNSNYTSDQLNEINNVYLPTQLMHSSMFSAVGDIFNTVYSETMRLSDDDPNLGKYRFWNKTFLGTSDFKTSGNKVTNDNHGTVFGYDAKPSQLQNGSYFVPTVFAAYSGANNKHSLKRSRSNNYMLGTKFAWLGSKTSFELIASYDFAKTHSKIDNFQKNNLKSHIFSLGGKVGYNIHVKNNFCIVPNIRGTYSFAHNTKSKMQYSNVKNKNLHLFDVAPGIDFVYSKGVWEASLGAKYNIQNKHNIKGSVDGTRIESNTLKKNHFEGELSISRKTGNGGHLGFGIVQDLGNRKGTKFKVSFSAKF